MLLIRIIMNSMMVFHREGAEECTSRALSFATASLLTYPAAEPSFFLTSVMLFSHLTSCVTSVVHTGSRSFYFRNISCFLLLSYYLRALFLAALCASSSSIAFQLSFLPVSAHLPNIRSSLTGGQGKSHLALSLEASKLLANDIS